MNWFKKKEAQKTVPGEIQDCKTVDDVLGEDDVHEAINELIENKADIVHFVMAYETKDGKIQDMWFGATSKVNYILDITKYDVLREDD